MRETTEEKKKERKKSPAVVQLRISSCLGSQRVRSGGDTNTKALISIKASSDVIRLLGSPQTLN